MISEGTKVPTYRSPGGAEEGTGRRQLERALRHGSALVAFCPGEQFTASPRHGVLAYIPWFQFKEYVEVQLVTNAGTTHDGPRFTGELAGISIVSDVEESVAEAFGVEYGTLSVSNGFATAIFLVDRSGSVRFARREDGGVEPATLAELQRRIDRINERETRRALS